MVWAIKHTSINLKELKSYRVRFLTIMNSVRKLIKERQQEKL